MGSRRHLLTVEAAVGISVATVVLIVVALADVLAGPAAWITAWLVVAPLVAAAFAPWRAVAWIGAAATAVAVTVTMLRPERLGHPMWIGTDIGLAVASMLAVGVSIFRHTQTQRLADLVKLAKVAQEAVIRPVEPRVGQFAVAGRYVSASETAVIGGDLYEALATPYGVRMIIGDVTGKGIYAVRTASLLLGAYRHVAFERADLRDVVADLDRVVGRAAGDEEFVTAALVEERGGTLTVLNCGHPAPLLLRQGQVIPLDPPGTAPPLGLHALCPGADTARVEHLEPGDRLLLFTDGLAEARRAGEFFPTQDRAWALLGHGTVEHGLASLASALGEWVPRGEFSDDIALLLLEYTGAAPAAEPTVPSWQIGGVPS